MRCPISGLRLASMVSSGVVEIRFWADFVFMNDSCHDDLVDTLKIVPLNDEYFSKSNQPWHAWT